MINLCWQKLKAEDEDEMTGWYNWYSGYEFGQTLGDGEGQGSLVCFSIWGCEESDMTKWLNNKNNNKRMTNWACLVFCKWLCLSEKKIGSDKGILTL